MKTNKIIVTLAVIFCFTGSVYAKSYFDEQTYPARVIITASALNVRSGPSTNHMRVGTVYRNNIIDCHGKMAGWYVVHLDNDTVGLVSGQYAKGYYPATPATPTPATPTPATPTPATPTPATPDKSVTGLTADEQEMLNLVNSERSKNGLSALTANLELTKVARVKSQDLVNNNYFAHNSPTYGTPFEMMKSFGITYKSAGENLAANSTVQAAHNALMNSSGHRANILSQNYNQIGIGIVSSPKYGKMFTQMFIGV